MRTPDALPRELAQRPFTVTEALAAGMTPDQLRGPSVWAPFRGVRVPLGLGRDLGVRCWALAALVPRAVFGGVTAAALLGVALPTMVDAADPVVIHVPSGPSVPQLKGLRVHRTDVGRTSRVGALSIAGPGAIWRHLVMDGRVTGDDLVVVADMLRKRWPGVDLAGCSPRGADARKRHLAALAESRLGVKSPQETRLRLILLRAGLPEPELNVEILDADGQWIAEGDLVWRKWKVVAEYDSERHFEDPKQRERDLFRRRNLDHEGWVLEVVTKADLRFGGHRAVAAVTGALRRQGATW